MFLLWSTLFANVLFMVYTICQCPFYGLHYLPMSLLWLTLFANVPFMVFTICQCPFCGLHYLPMSLLRFTLFANVPFMVYTICQCPFYGLHYLPMFLLWTTLFAKVHFVGCSTYLFIMNIFVCTVELQSLEHLWHHENIYNFAPPLPPLKPHFYIVKLALTGVYIIFFSYFCSKHRLWVPTIYVLSRNMKNIRIFIWKFALFF